MTTEPALNMTQRRVRDLLAAVAATGARCPTNQAIGDSLNLAPKCVGEAVADLRDVGVIEILSLHRARQVTIVATGQSTAAVEAAPHWRARRGIIG